MRIISTPGHDVTMRTVHVRTCTLFSRTKVISLIYSGVADHTEMLRQRVASTLAGRLRASSGNPPPDPRDGGLVETSSDEDGETTSAAREGKPWMRVDKIVYEEQLEKLQEQLVQVMLENQALQGVWEDKKGALTPSPPLHPPPPPPLFPLS